MQQSNFMRTVLKSSNGFLCSNKIEKATRFHRNFSTKSSSLLEEELDVEIPIKLGRPTSAKLTKLTNTINAPSNNTLSQSTSNSNVSVGQAVWNIKGSKFGFLSKGPELMWKDLQENRQEFSILQSEKKHNLNNSNPNNSNSLWRVASEEDQKNTTAAPNNLQWYDDWKNTFTKVYKTSNQTPQLEIKSSAGSSNSFAYSMSNIQILGSKTNTEVEKKDDNKKENVYYNHRSTFDELGKSLGLRSLEDWYYVNILDVEDKNVRSILTNNYGSSLIQALIQNYPEFDWKLANFDNSFKGLLNDDIDRSFIDKAIEEQDGNSKKFEDTNTTRLKFKDHWQIRLFHKQPNAALTINRASPLPRDMNNKGSANDLSFAQPEKEHLFEIVRKLFPKNSVEYEYYNRNFIFSDTRRPFSLSVYIPDLKLGFDYFDDPNVSGQYAVGANYNFNFFHRAKRLVCEKMGITVIEVPSWWDKKTESVLSAVKRCRPDLKLD